MKEPAIFDGGYHEKVYPIEECIHVPFLANVDVRSFQVTDDEVD